MAGHMGCIEVAGRLWNGRRAAVSIADGVVVGGKLGGCRRYVFGRRHLVLPGAVDMHVHFRDWGLRHKEDMASASLAALQGGVVAVGDMPNTVPHIRDASLARRRWDDGSSLPVEYRLYMGIPEDPEEVAKARPYVVGVKAYPADIERYGWDHIVETFAVANRLGLLAVVHCEEPGAMAEGPNDSEVLCAHELARWVVARGIRVHLTHVSDPRTVELVQAYRPTITLDVTPHHLLLSREECVARHGRGPCYVRPPLRSREDRKRLFRSLLLGMVDAVATDHAPHGRDEKASDDPPPGICGINVALFLLLDLVRRGLMGLHDVVRLYSSRPRGLMGLRLGLEEGSPAGLAVVELVPGRVDPAAFSGSCRFSPLEGLPTYGRTRLVATPRSVYVDGEVAPYDGP